MTILRTMARSPNLILPLGSMLPADGAPVVVPPSLHLRGWLRVGGVEPSRRRQVVLAPLPGWLRGLGEGMASPPVEGVALP